MGTGGLIESQPEVETSGQLSAQVGPIAPKRPAWRQLLIDGHSTTEPPFLLNLNLHHDDAGRHPHSSL